MQPKFYDTLTRVKRDFLPSGDVVRMYSCGPTVYSTAHIGNMRAYIFMDSIRRVLRYCGYDVLGVMNITDVGHLTDDGDDGDDKMLKASRDKKMQPLELAKYYTEIFVGDLSKLNIGLPEKVVKATDHIDQMIRMCVSLVEKGFAYETDDGIYFDVSKANDYGKLSGDRQGKMAGARIDVNTQKHNPQDFAIWKKAPSNHIMKWESPWGLGYPGWHIECSAMSYEYLGDKFDIHTGGIDHIPVHHENEIAQSEAICGCVPAEFWMHNQFMQVDGGKMSKSLGTAYTLKDLEDKGYDPMILRGFCHTAHYRKPINFSWDTLDAMKTSYTRLLESLNQHKSSKTSTDKEILNKFKSEFDQAILDDLNIPLGIGVLHSFIKLPYSIDVYNLVLEFDKVLGLKLDREYTPTIKETTDTDIPQDIKQKAEQRWQAKQAKDFKLADTIRNELTSLGYAIVDKPGGYDIKKL